MPTEKQLKQIVEAALLAAGRPLSLDQLQALYDTQGGVSVAGGKTPGATDTQGGVSVAGGKTPGATDEGSEPDKKQLREVLDELTEDYAGRGIEVREVGSGFRIQVRSEYAPWVSRLYAERPPKYSRALLETLALIAYRQPITRGEIEDIRGVSVSTNIVKTLTEREWVRVVGHRDVPGKPALYATTREFLDYFNLKSLSELPTLAEIRDLDSINRELELQDPDVFESQDQDQAKSPLTGPEQELEPADATDLESMLGVAPDYQPEPETLIEFDPDGETDSGVTHQLHEHAEPADGTTLEKPIDFDPDGETDSMTDAYATPEPQVKRSDETE